MAGSSQKLDKSEALGKFIEGHLGDHAGSWAPLPGQYIELPFGLTMHGFMILLVAAVLVVIFGVLYKKDDEVPSGLTNALEAFILYIRDEIAIPALGEKDGRRLTPMLLTLFFFILGINLLGLVPGFAAPTSNVNVTFALASMILLIMVLGGIILNGPVGFIKAFIPHGVPWPVLFIIVPIEFVGMFIKCFALMIRLAANMVAGHIVLFTLLGLVLVLGYATAIVIVPITACMFLLKIFICLLQAYIFTLLSAMFIGMIFHPAH
jgi:F-type H+-transporting ATPase subunit a